MLNSCCDIAIIKILGNKSKKYLLIWIGYLRYSVSKFEVDHGWIEK
jgi:hypothetical protein